MHVLIVFFLFLAVLSVIGLIFFLISLIRKKNIGCGIAGLLPIILIVSVYISINYSTSHISDNKVIECFEKYGVTFPPSGKILEKNYQEFLNFTGDMHIAFMVEVDTLTYNRLLQKKLKDNESIFEYRKKIEQYIAENFDYNVDTLDYKKIVKSCWKLQDVSPYRHIFDTLVSRGILSEHEVKHRILIGDEFSYFTDEVSSSSLLKKHFPAEDCAYADGTWWFHRNKRIIVYELIDY